VRTLSDKHDDIVFLLWGNHARAKRPLIDQAHNCVREATHPSPRSVRGFRYHHHFSRTNKRLIRLGKNPIDW